MPLQSPPSPRLAPGDRVLTRGAKQAHLIRAVDGRFAFPACAADEAFLADLRAEDAPRIAGEKVPTCQACTVAMRGERGEVA